MRYGVADKEIMCLAVGGRQKLQVVIRKDITKDIAEGIVVEIAKKHASGELKDKEAMEKHKKEDGGNPEEFRVVEIVVVLGHAPPPKK